ncbi:MAG: YbaN family protein [Bacillota bacterium]|nr:YbaN family protein [Bacillota bacterium]
MGIKKILLIGTGCIGVGLGAVGAVMPFLPSFPFLMLAAVCFAKSSERLDRWFKGTRLYKNNLESYVNGQGMTRQTKTKVITLVTILFGIAFYMMRRVPVGLAVLGIIWLFHIIYFIFVVKNKK